MPRGDRTGPMGDGSRRGRAAGFCAGFDMPGYANTAIPGGLRMGGGRRARGCWWPAGGWGRWSRPFGVGRSGGYFGGYALAAQPFEPELEKEALKHRSQALQSELDAVNKRLTEMDEQEKTS